MKRCFLLAVLLLFALPEALAQQGRFADITARPQLETAPQTSPVVVRGDDFLQLDRFYGYFNDALPTQGYGYADLDGLDYTKVADYPSTADNLPLGGTIGPDGRFWFVGRLGSGAHTMVSFDLMDPELSYEEIAFEIDEYLLFGAGEQPAGLAYDPESNTMVMASLYCDLDDEGAYRQTLLYSIDLDTGIPTYMRDLADPNADGTATNLGVCLISFTWDGGDEIFGVDLGSDDMVQIDASTGEVVDRYSDPFLFEVCYVQDSAYNYNDGNHYLMAHTCGSTGGGAPYYGSVYQCNPADGCTLQGFINDNQPDGYEMLLAAFLWPELVSSEEGASAQGVRMEVYPNPMASRSTVTLALDAPQTVTVAVYDLLGRRVATLHDGVATQLELSFDGQSLPSGVYFVSARGERFTTTQKVVVAR